MAATTHPRGRAIEQPRVAPWPDASRREHVDEARVVEQGGFMRAVRFFVAAVILAAVALFAAINTRDIGIDVLVQAEVVPLWAVIGGSAFGGFVAGMLLVDRRRCD